MLLTVTLCWGLLPAFKFIYVHGVQLVNNACAYMDTHINTHMQTRADIDEACIRVVGTSVIYTPRDTHKDASANSQPTTNEVRELWLKERLTIMIYC